MQYSILVIDDNKDLRENTAEILDLAGYQTFTADNGKRGVEMALREKPTMIVCDIMMPELDGYGVLHLLRKNPETRQIPLIFLTAKSERADFRKGMEMGADDYITKPFDDIELLNAVETRLLRLSIGQRDYSHDGFSRFLEDVGAVAMGKSTSAVFDISNYARKQQLYPEGKKPRHLFYVARGKVKTSRSHEDGKEYITDIYGPGDFIGYTSLIEDSSYLETATILEDAEIIQVPRDYFLKLLYNDLSISTKFIHLIAKNVKEKEERLLGLAYSSLRKRIASALVDIAGKFSTGGNAAVLEISREEIAQYVGTATESLIRTLSDFKEEGLVRIEKGKVIISDQDRLARLIR